MISNAIQETKLLLLKDKEQPNFLKTNKSQQNIIEESQKFLKDELLHPISLLLIKLLKWDNKQLKNTSNKEINWSPSWSLNYMTIFSIKLKKRLSNCNKMQLQSTKQSSETDNLKPKRDIIREWIRLDMDHIWSPKLCLMSNSH